MFEKLSVMNRKFEDELQNDFRGSNERTYNTEIIIQDYYVINYK
jgi:hypothetical protein